MNTIKIAIGSENKAKISAVENIIGQVWGNVEFSYHSTNSMVRAQPLNDDEAIDGAINRARQALELGKADYGIGLEGTVDTNKHGMFLCGWVVILSKDNIYGPGSSGKMLLPDDIAYRINAGEELGPIMQELMKDDKNSIRQHEGANGILSNGLYTRKMEFETAITCALAKFVSPHLYK